MAIKYKCGYPSCNELSDSFGYCTKHKAESQERRRQYQESRKPFSSARRSCEGMYNTERWRKIRNQVIAAHPYCERCRKGHTSENPLTVHHHIPPRGNEFLFYDIKNCGVLCRNCHRQDTAKEIQDRISNATGLSLTGRGVSIK